MSAPSDFLMTDEELRRLTGYQRARNQAAWIRDTYRIPASVNAANECIVVRAHLVAAGVPLKAKERPQVLQVRKRR